MIKGASIIWADREPASAPAVTLLFLFLLVGSGVLTRPPGEGIGTALCAAARVEKAESRWLSAGDRSCPDEQGSELRQSLPGCQPAFRSLKRRGIPAPRAPDLA